MTKSKNPSGRKVVREKRVIAWADVGSHNGIFEFMSGSIADSYPHLLHIFSEKITPDLRKVVITYKSK